MSVFQGALVRSNLKCDSAPSTFPDAIRRHREERERASDAAGMEASRALTGYRRFCPNAIPFAEETTRLGFPGEDGEALKPRRSNFGVVCFRERAKFSFQKKRKEVNKIRIVGKGGKRKQVR